MVRKLREQLMKFREPRSWVLEEHDPVEGQVRAYRYEATALQSKAVSPWVCRFGPATLDECRRELARFRDKTQLRIRNEQTNEICEGD